MCVLQSQHTVFFGPLHKCIEPIPEQPLESADATAQYIPQHSLLRVDNSFGAD